MYWISAAGKCEIWYQYEISLHNPRKLLPNTNALFVYIHETDNLDHKSNFIVSDNVLSPGRRQGIIWTNAGILLIGPLATNFSEILIGIQTFSFRKMHLKISSAKWRPFCLGLNELMYECVCLFRLLTVEQYLVASLYMCVRLFTREHRQISRASISSYKYIKKKLNDKDLYACLSIVYLQLNNNSYCQLQFCVILFTRKYRQYQGPRYPLRHVIPPVRSDLTYYQGWF